MPVREVRAAGIDSVKLATELLQRARLADPQAGVWEAADIQWSWRIPRKSDDIEKLFWIDDEGPVAGVLLSSFRESRWQCDPIVVPGAPAPEPETVWNRAIEYASTQAPGGFEVPVSDDDQLFTQLAKRSGFSAGEGDWTSWLDAADRAPVVAPAEGFELIDRADRRDERHPLHHRQGEDVERRLNQCTLYDPSLDLAVLTSDGQVAGYSLYWFDPVTKVGLVEPVRVEDDFQRRGLARAMLTAGIDRLAGHGAKRIKVSFQTETAGALYTGVGFQQTSTTTWYLSPSR